MPPGISGPALKHGTSHAWHLLQVMHGTRSVHADHPSSQMLTDHGLPVAEPRQQVLSVRHELVNLLPVGLHFAQSSKTNIVSKLDDRPTTNPFAQSYQILVLLELQAQRCNPRVPVMPAHAPVEEFLRLMLA